MKSYTDLEQSKKLAEILPLESADMHYSTWTILDSEFIVSPNQGQTIEELQEDYGNQIIPAWSLSALLDILAKETHNIDEDGYVVLSSYKGNWWNISLINCVDEGIKESNDPLDAAFEMVCWLKENKKI